MIQYINTKQYYLPPWFKNEYQKKIQGNNGQHVKERKHLYSVHRNETHEAFLWLQINTAWIFLRKWQIELSCDPAAQYLALIRRKLIQYAEEISSVRSSTTPRSQEMETAQTSISCQAVKENGVHTLFCHIKQKLVSHD